MSPYFKNIARFSLIIAATIVLISLPAAAQPLLPPEASAVASDIDFIFWFILAITTFFFVLVVVLLIYFMIKYRAKKENEEGIHFHGHMGLEIAWTIVPAVIFILIAVYSGFVLENLDNPPEDAMVIGVLGYQFGWNFTYPDNSGQGTVTNTNELHIPVNEPIKLEIQSRDVLHSFWVPAFRLKQDALPEPEIRFLWLEATETGTYPIICAELCGAGHSGMLARVVVEERDDYNAWIEEQMALSDQQGLTLAQNNGCIGCHTIDGSPGVGPTWQGLFGKTVMLNDGSSVVADEAYITQSIREPGSQVTAGFQAGLMPAFTEDQLSDEEVQQIINFIRTLTSDGDSMSQDGDQDGAGDGDSPEDDGSSDGDTDGDGGEVDLVARGEQLAQATGCMACHTTDGSVIVGPTWQGLYGKMENIQGMDEPVEVDDEYLHESIRDPNAQVVEGFNANIMQAYNENQLSDEDIDAIIAYIRSLSEQ